jgi:hypothetical protein
VEYAGVVALVAALDGVTVVVALVAGKAVDGASLHLGEVDAVAADRAVVEPKVPAVVSVEAAHVARIGVIGRRVVRVQASYLVRPWLTSLFRFPARYGLFAAGAGYECQKADFQKEKTWRMISWVRRGAGWEYD